jgi:hypothetical protein
MERQRWHHTCVRAASDLFDRAVMAFVTRASGRLVAAVTLFLYPGIGLILPISLHWSMLWLVYANVLGALFAGAVSLGWFSAQVEAAKRRHLVEWTTELRLLTAEEFEWLVGETFKRDGWKVRETGRQDAADGNIDLELTMNGRRKIVQCKRWTSWLVKLEEIQRFEGTLFREGLRGDSGIFVTLSDFTQSARIEAKKTGVTLINGRDLYAKIERVRRAETCDTCHQPMRIERSDGQWRLHCITPGCSGKRELGNQAGRAVELLTEPPVQMS